MQYPEQLLCSLTCHPQQPREGVLGDIVPFSCACAVWRGHSPSGCHCAAYASFSLNQLSWLEQFGKVLATIPLTREKSRSVGVSHARVIRRWRQAGAEASACTATARREACEKTWSWYRGKRAPFLVQMSSGMPLCWSGRIIKTTYAVLSVCKAENRCLELIPPPLLISFGL